MDKYKTPQQILNEFESVFNMYTNPENYISDCPENDIRKNKEILVNGVKRMYSKINKLEEKEEKRFEDEMDDGEGGY